MMCIFIANVIDDYKLYFAAAVAHVHYYENKIAIEILNNLIDFYIQSLSLNSK